MKILVTNDDGYAAQGLAILKQMCRTLGEVVVVAPRENNSYVGHKVTVGRQMSLEQVGTGEWVLDGTPADCVRVALKALQLNVDLVVSGINHGANLGADVYGSGTVAAAREAFFLGVPGIAFSQFRRGRSVEIEWGEVSKRAELTLQSILSKSMGCNYWSVNFPCPKPFAEPVDLTYCDLDVQSVDVDYVWCEQRKHVQYSANYQQRPRTPGKDIAECIDNNKITVARLG